MTCLSGKCLFFFEKERKYQRVITKCWTNRHTKFWIMRNAITECCLLLSNDVLYYKCYAIGSGLFGYEIFNLENLVFLLNWNFRRQKQITWDIWYPSVRTGPFKTWLVTKKQKNNRNIFTFSSEFRYKAFQNQFFVNFFFHFTKYSDVHNSFRFISFFLDILQFNKESLSWSLPFFFFRLYQKYVVIFFVWAQWELNCSLVVLILNDTISLKQLLCWLFSSHFTCSW